MSNTMWTSATIIFEPEDLDFRAIKAELDLVKDLKVAPNSGDDLKGHVFWWWLSGAVTFDNGEMYWGIGAGHSQHTFRDFALCVHMLGTFAHKYTDVTIKVIDDTSQSNRDMGSFHYVCHFIPNHMYRELDDQQKKNVRWGYMLNRPKKVHESSFDVDPEKAAAALKGMIVIEPGSAKGTVKVSKGNDVRVLNQIPENPAALFEQAAT